MRLTPALALCLAFGCSSDAPAPAVDAEVVDACPGDWWDCAFKSRRSIEVKASGEILSNFPLLVSLSAAEISEMQDQGADLRFVGAQGAVLPYEIDTWLTDGGAQIWVRVPSVEADAPTSLTMYWQNAAAEAPTNGEQVWADGYQGVWHLNQGATETAPDSSGNLNSGTPQGLAGDAQREGQVGTSIEFDGSGDWIEVPHSASLDITESALTLSAWAYMTEAQSSDSGLIVKAGSGQFTAYNYQLGIQSTQLANVRILSNTQTYLTGLSPLEPQRWYYIVGVYDGSKSTLYVNAHADNVRLQVGPVVTVPDPLVLGRRAIDDERYFKGRIDEARVSNVARSEAWIRAEFLNVSGDLVTLNEVEGI